MAAPLVTPLGLADSTVRVQPVVLFTICDAFIRRNEGQRRVIGALLGTVSDGVVEVKTAYAVPHTEDQGGSDGQVAVDHQHHATMLALQRKVDSRERVVGWFSSDVELAPSDALLHSFFTSTAEPGSRPVLLKVDATLASGGVTVGAYVSRSLAVRGTELAREFLRVPCEIATAEAERVGLNLLRSESTPLIPSAASDASAAAPAAAAASAAAPAAGGAAEGGAGAAAPATAAAASPLDGTLGALRSTLDEAIRALDEARAVPGEAAWSPERAALGRSLAEAVASVPRVPDEDLEGLLASEQRDLLVSLYLANLIRAHISIADKLGTLQLPLV